MIRLIGIACVAPSLWLSVDAQVAQGASAGIMMLAIASVLLAPLSAVGAVISFERKAFGTATLCGFAFVFMLSFNYLNALGATAVARDTMRDTRGVAMANEVSRGQRHLELARKLERLQLVSQSETPEMIRADITRLQADPIYNRAKRCESGFVTKGDSQALCERIAIAEKRLAAASEIKKIEADLWGNGTSVANSAPSSADVQIDNLAALASVFGAQIDTNIKLIMSAGLNGFAALIAELIGGLGGLIARAVFWRKTDQARGESEDFKTPIGGLIIADECEPAKLREAPAIPQRKTAPAKRAKKKPLAPAIVAVEADVVRWANECLVQRHGSELSGGEVYQHFSIWCEPQGFIPLNPSRFGPAMAALGWGKVKKRLVMYQGISFKSAAPALKVVS